MQRPLFAFSLSLDLKSRAFWFFIFTDEKGTPVKIGTTYSLCLKDKVEGKNKAGRDILSPGAREEKGAIFLSHRADPLRAHATLVVADPRADSLSREKGLPGAGENFCIYLYKTDRHTQYDEV